ncbi:TTLL3 monoglycylase, partial [Centropus unirufus]|nr:TTLL3 monoglycylase [Centropus unirufus]
EKKIFTVQGPYPIIRSLLRARGWVEKKFLSEGREEEKQEEEKQEEEQQDEDADAIHDIMSRLVRNQVPYFIWTNRCSAFDCELLQHDQVVNHYTRSAVFTTKNGLCQNLRNLPWFDQADPDTFFPRCYRLGNTNEQEAFIEDFRLTAARSLLKVALKRAEEALGRTEQPQKPGEGAAVSRVPHLMPCPAGPGPTAHSQLLEEALHICELHLGSLAHEDIDRDALLPHKAGTNWDQFLRDYYRVVHEGARLMVTGAQQERCQTLLQRLKEQLPQMSMEGDHNVWILKPGAKSRGRGKAREMGQGGTGSWPRRGILPSPHPPGIVCTARLEELLQLVGCSGAPALRPGEWVVQKYVERPLLIFGTKFDVRQWFLVTDWNPLTVWFYRDSYLRFCSRTFSLRHLDSARHLCNVSIQKRYKPAWDQPSQLPPDQIWSSQQLQKYLAQTGRADAWHKVMVPGMKAAVLAALHSAQGQVGNRKGSFELYGADFIFGEDCQPWLLEINASPTMAPSSAVTSRLCASVQRDTLRVVIDHRKDPTCSTGGFELISKE